MTWFDVISQARLICFIFLLTSRRTPGICWRNPWLPRNPSWKTLG